ncbi:GNAT family N-acetyltransferase [Sciscionella marina]|uniref:GNAT family N-acetyltransferase n=1 Tax=Sciscionella marina TaxID=508770 RepID=UPI00039CA681|nr:GNAT family N-acetyltransferase [Sciscionella marina]
MHEVRVLHPDQHRAATDVFLDTLHERPVEDRMWERHAEAFEPGRMLGAYADGELVATVGSFPSAVRVPGGATVPMAAVTNVGVRADHTRKGMLTSLKRGLFGEVREPIAGLHASEAGIYGRFGYGIATRSITVTVDRTKARAKNPGSVRMVPAEEAAKLLPELHERIGFARAGAMRRPAGWWTGMAAEREQRGKHTVVVHRNPEGVEDGYVQYGIHRPGEQRELTVKEFWAATPDSYAELWRYVLSVDLVGTVVVPDRPRDEPLDLLLEDPRAARITNSSDELWLRLLDVPAALAARSYGPGSVVLGVHDDFLPENSGNYRIGAEGATRVEEEPDLRCDVPALATLYLGDRSPSELAFAGRLTGPDEAIRRADAVLRTERPPWSGTDF